MDFNMTDLRAVILGVEYLSAACLQMGSACAETGARLDFLFVFLGSGSRFAGASLCRSHWHTLHAFLIERLRHLAFKKHLTFSLLSRFTKTFPHSATNLTRPSRCYHNRFAKTITASHIFTLQLPSNHSIKEPRTAMAPRPEILAFGHDLVSAHRPALRANSLITRHQSILGSPISKQTCYDFLSSGLRSDQRR